MTGGPVKRSITLSGHRTSVSLEDEFWRAFRDIARAEGKPLNRATANCRLTRTKKPKGDFLVYLDVQGQSRF